MDVLNTFCSIGNFMPHGYCYLWLPKLVALHAVSDSLIGLAYFIIPFTLIYFIRRRRDLPFNWMFVCFGLFIILCGITHMMEVLTLWRPVYWISGMIKAVTAIISLTVAILFIRLIPRALSIPSHKMLNAANAEIRQLNATLEQRITERTAELIAANKELQQEIQERNKIEQSLRESNERFQAVAEITPQIIWTLNAAGKAEYYNSQWLKYTGLSWDDPFEETGLDMIHPDERENVKQHMQECLRTGKTFEAEYRIRDKHGVYQWHLGRATPLRDKSGKIIKWFGVATNIDAQKRSAEESRQMQVILEQRVQERTLELQQANQALQDTLEELERSNHELAQFAYVASHDLQEPLRMISSYTQLLERRYKDKLDKDGLEFIHYAVDGAKRLQQLITALLNYSRLSTNNEPATLVNCNEILQQALANLKLAIEEAGIKISYTALPSIYGKPVKLLQLFQNLIANAIKFRNTAHPAIDIEAKLIDRKWLFTVTDNGIGIGQEYFDKIFVIFQRLHGKHSYPGTGIGLAICKRIVEQHKGEIWVKSEVGKGTTFYFTLPATNIE